MENVKHQVTTTKTIVLKEEEVRRLLRKALKDEGIDLADYKFQLIGLSNSRLTLTWVPNEA